MAPAHIRKMQWLQAATDGRKQTGPCATMMRAHLLIGLMPGVWRPSMHHLMILLGEMPLPPK